MKEKSIHEDYAMWVLNDGEERNPCQPLMIITFIVPAYNSEGTLEKCLHSLLDKQSQSKIEILIVNDGSTDSTAEIAQVFVNKHPNCRLINKENGGHGSVINVASKLASGKYIKVIDSDDWVQTQNLPSYVKALENAQADVVLTHFRTQNELNGRIRTYAMRSVKYNHIYAFDDFWKHKRKVCSVCNFHGITYRTEFYRNCNIRLSEKISYEDQEYATLPFAFAPTVMPVDLYLYEYQLGNPNQSCSPQNMEKRLNHLAKVIKVVCEQINANMALAVRSYIMYKMQMLLRSYYIAAMVNAGNKKAGRVKSLSMLDKIKQHNKGLHFRFTVDFIACYALSYFA